MENERRSNISSRKPKVLSKCVAIAILAYPYTIHAEEYAESDTCHSTSQLSEIEVIAKRAYPARGTVLSKTLFTAEELSALPMQTLEQALRSNPAVDVRERGGQGVQADVSLYGSNYDQTIILLNGIDFTDARTGHQSNSLPIDIETVSKITATTDIIGSNSYSGAINYMTKFADRQFTKAGVTGGDFGYWRTFMGTGIHRENASTMLSASYTKSNGYQPNTDFNNLNLYGYAILEPEINRKHIGDFELQAGYQKRQFGSYGFYSLQYPWQWEATQTFLSSAKWSLNTNEHYELSAYASYRRNTDLYALYREGYEAPSWYTGPNHHLTDDYGIGAQFDYKWGFGTTAVGYDYTYNHVYSNVLGDEMAQPKKVQGYPNAFYTKEYGRNVSNIWIRQSIRASKRMHLNVSANLVDCRYGTDVMWGGAANIHPLNGWALDLSASRTMRLPTFTDLFYTAPGHVSNKDLKPEYAKTIRMSNTVTYRHMTIGTNIFYRWGTNIIDWVRSCADGPWESKQYSKVNTFGAIAVVTFDWPRQFLHHAQISYGYLDDSHDSGEMMSQYDINFMHNKLSGNVNLNLFKGMDLGLVCSYFDRSGSFYDVNGELHRYPKYWLMDARLTYTIGVFRIHVDVNNIFNQTYFDFGGLRMPSRWAMGGVEITL